MHKLMLTTHVMRYARMRNAGGNRIGGVAKLPFTSRADKPGQPSISLAAAIYLRSRRISVDEALRRLRRISENRDYTFGLAPARNSCEGNAVLAVSAAEDDVGRLYVVAAAYFYCEHPNETAELLLYGHTVPASACVALTAGGHRLSGIIEDNARPFYLRADPEVLAAENVSMGSESAVLLTVASPRDEANWSHVRAD